MRFSEKAKKIEEIFLLVLRSAVTNFLHDYYEFVTKHIRNSKIMELRHFHVKWKLWKVVKNNWNGKMMEFTDFIKIYWYCYFIKSFTPLCATFRIKEPFLCHPIHICMNVGKKNPIIWIDIICASSVKGAFERWFLMNWALKDRATFELFPVV